MVDLVTAAESLRGGERLQCGDTGQRGDSRHGQDSEALQASILRDPRLDPVPHFLCSWHQVWPVERGRGSCHISWSGHGVDTPGLEVSPSAGV